MSWRRLFLMLLRCDHFATELMISGRVERSPELSTSHSNSAPGTAMAAAATGAFVFLLIFLPSEGSDSLEDDDEDDDELSDEADEEDEEEEEEEEEEASGTGPAFRKPWVVRRRVSTSVGTIKLWISMRREKGIVFCWSASASAFQ
jgi:hypothetical protein